MAGAREMIRFCLKNDIPHEICGKLIVATNAAEAARLDLLLAGGEANGLRELRLLDHAAMREIEPHVGGVRAFHVPSTGITDYSEVTAKYAAIARRNGVEIKTGARVTGFGNAEAMLW